MRDRIFEEAVVYIAAASIEMGKQLFDNIEASYLILT